MLVTLVAKLKWIIRGVVLLNVNLYPNNRVMHGSVICLLEKLVILNKDLRNLGIRSKVLQEIGAKCRRGGRNNTTLPSVSGSAILALICVATIFVSIILKILLLDVLVKLILGTRCILPNSYFVWESLRPETDCSMCKDIRSVIILPNITRDDFKLHAYSPQPMICKGAALHWPAMVEFTYDFLKGVYDNIEGGYTSVEEECQFLTFKTEFITLKDLFSMPKSRVHLEDGEKAWYVGWSNCHPEVLTALRQYYGRPHFLPSDAEHARVDYIFTGYHQGAVMHMDYISRLMWQAQIRGRKIWRLLPPPECDGICSGVTFQVDPGDIVLLDTRQWYHDTHINQKELSLTISSEYG